MPVDGGRGENSTNSLDADSVRECACGHQEWQHVWNSVPLPDGRGPFNVAACSVAGCDCPDWVDAESLERMVTSPAAVPDGENSTRPNDSEERLMTVLVAFYNADSEECARVCDEVLDRSGELLGRVREEARCERG